MTILSKSKLNPKLQEISKLWHTSLFNFTEEIMLAFRQFGQLLVDWPHKAESKSYFPPKGKQHSSLSINLITSVCFVFSLPALQLPFLP